MVVIAGIQFEKNGALYYYDVNQLTLRVGDYVVVETTHGLDLGEVVVGAREVEDDKSPAQLKRIVRIATQQDIQHSIENREKERQAFGICQRKIAEHKLEMKLVSVEYSFDNSKILFFFTANGRIDFRSLVKDLASVFKTRIELRQIGVRDEARMLGGLGQCGRPICCGAFLDDFQPVSIKMAKEQNLSLNPTKISGVCGRLMCCLKYEQEQYEQIRKRMPKMGREIRTPDGFGTVVDQNILKETVTVRFQTGDSTETKVYTLDDLARPAEKKEALPEIKEPVAPSPAPALAEAENIAAESAESAPAGAERKREERRPRKDRPKTTPRPGQEDRPERKARAVKPVQQDSEARTEKPARASRLGQPVRRENPLKAKNGTAAPAADAGANSVPAGEATTAPVSRAPRTDAAPVSDRPARPAAPVKQNRSSQWAAELEKAMNNIDKN